MSEPRTPQVPMVDPNGQPFYPLTQYNQIVMPGGGRWDGETGSAVELDTTLKEAGKAADAGAVGTALEELKSEKADKAGWTAGKNVVTGADGKLTTEDKPTIPVIPSTLPNPHALTINGESYDGSEPVEMKIRGGSLYTNLADNSDFTRWVAQAGIGGKHGNETYGGDRWILTSGTLASTAYDGDPNPDGDGYSGITLNGTLVQVVPSPPDVATAFVETVSGEAEISYDASKGEIILTSAGGVIKNVLLLEGEWAEKPEYVSKGYGVEFVEALRYLTIFDQPQIGMLWFEEYKNTIFFPIQMRTVPEMELVSGNPDLYSINCWTSDRGIHWVATSEGYLARAVALADLPRR